MFNAASVAAAANMSVRTAQRVTAEHGTTVQGLIDKVREHRATELLRDNHNDIGSIAFLLGYSDETGLSKSFPTMDRSEHPLTIDDKQLNKQIE